MHNIFQQLIETIDEFFFSKCTKEIHFINLFYSLKSWVHVCEKTIESEQTYTDENIDALLLKLNIEEDKIPIIKEKIFITTEQLKSYKSILKREKRKFIDNKCILGLKYQTIKEKSTSFK